MSALSIILVVFEIVIAFAVVWAILNEDFFIKLENRLFDRLSESVKAYRRAKKQQKAYLARVTGKAKTEDHSVVSPFVA